MQKIFTREGMEAVHALKKLGIDKEVSENIIKEVDNELSRVREVLRQYRFCYGDTHNWLNAIGERVRIAKQVLNESEENYKKLDYHNL